MAKARRIAAVLGTLALAGWAAVALVVSGAASADGSSRAPVVTVGGYQNCATVGRVQTVDDPVGDLQNNVFPGRAVRGYGAADITQVRLARNSRFVCVDVRAKAPFAATQSDTLTLSSITGARHGEANTAPSAEVSFGREPGEGWRVELSDGRVGQVGIGGSIGLAGPSASLVFARSALRSYVTLTSFQWSVLSVIPVPHTGSTEIYDCAPGGGRRAATYPPGTRHPKPSSYCTL